MKKNYIKSAKLFLLIGLLISLTNCYEKNVKLEILKIYKKDYKSMSSFTGEVYANTNSNQKLDTTILKSACKNILPEISPDIARVCIHILQGNKKVAKVIVAKEITDYKFIFLSTDTLKGNFKKRIELLISENRWQYPNNLEGIWDVHGMGFIYFYKDGEVLKTETYHYDGAKQVNKDPIVNRIKINNVEYLKHIWSSDYVGPNEQFYQINEYNDLVYFEPHNFMQYIFDNIK